jgi:hypothetical protein
MEQKRDPQDQEFGSKAAEEQAEVDRLEREGGEDAVEQADPGERTEPHAGGRH